jgi:hypothetical protein
MYCPSCGKETPENSRFCLHCGQSITAPSTAARVPTEWEYKDFVYEFEPPGRGMWAKLGSGGYTEAGAKLEFYQNSQYEISAEIQKWLDEGWQPVSQIDSSCVELRTGYSHRDKSAGYWLMMAFFSIPSFGLVLLFALLSRSHIAEPERFVVQMRRPVTLKDRAIRPSPAIPQEPATIQIHRPLGFTAALRNADVYLDNKPVEKLASGETKQIVVLPGKHSVYMKIASFVSERLQLDLKPGQSVQLRCRLATGAWTSQLHLEQISSEVSDSRSR